MPLKRRFGILSLVCLPWLFGLTGSAKEAGCVPESQGFVEIQRSINCLQDRLRTIWNVLSPIPKKLEDVENATESLSKIFGYGSVRNGSAVIIIRPAVQLVSKPTMRNVGHGEAVSEVPPSIACNHDRPGVYNVRFTPGFDSAPVVVVTTFGEYPTSQSRFGFGWISYLDKDGFQIETSQDGKELTDLNFSFIVLSPEP